MPTPRCARLPSAPSEFLSIGLVFGGVFCCCCCCLLVFGWGLLLTWPHPHSDGTDELLKTDEDTADSVSGSLPKDSPGTLLDSEWDALRTPQPSLDGSFASMHVRSIVSSSKGSMLGDGGESTPGQHSLQQLVTPESLSPAEKTGEDPGSNVESTTATAAALASAGQAGDAAKVGAGDRTGGDGGGGGGGDGRLVYTSFVAEGLSWGRGPAVAPPAEAPPTQAGTGEASPDTGMVDGIEDLDFDDEEVDV